MGLKRALLAAGIILVAFAASAAGRDTRPDGARVELGRRLFYDADLSINGTMSCATCHEQKHAFTDTNSTRPGATGEPGRRNIMALANVAAFNSLTWADPRQTTLEGQVSVPVFGEHPVEMGMDGKEAEITRRLSADKCYRAMFADAFGGPVAITMPRIAAALAAFERTLISRSAPYDAYLKGEGALSPAASRGEGLFNRHGCASCHAGALFTDAADVGRKAEAAFHDIGAPRGLDVGLAEITREPKDAYRFRTPSLRNIALTGPYLHDGSAANLPLAIAAHRFLDEPVAAQEMPDLIAFLEALTDQAFIRDERFALPERHCGKKV
ncbi:MAG TPA: cytochrome c peroxidase [Hyphomicrobiaceae bacterium]|nr:cytochrome c peroxidase [Hyphomicrobiaceae bacterium]